MNELAGGAFVIQPGVFGNIEGSRRYRVPISRQIGARQIAQTVSVYDAGRAASRRNPSAEEVLYVARGRGECLIDGYRYELSPGTAVYLPPGSVYQIDSTAGGGLEIVSVCCPEESQPETGAVSLLKDCSDTQPFRTIQENARQPIPTGDREFRLLVNEDFGARRVTQFIGIIPPGRAPMHYHTYEEAIYIIEGEGVVWTESGAADESSGKAQGIVGSSQMETASSRFSQGTSIYLPPGVRHCLENTGRDRVKLLGVFYPSGSPSVSYDD